MQLGFDHLVGVSAAMQRVYRLVRAVSVYTYPVLIVGEAGTGKELVARTIHARGRGNEHTFARINCTALAEVAGESQQFGSAHRGAFEQVQQWFPSLAGEGTLFLDEVADMPRKLQPAAIRALRGAHGTPLKVRVISATQKDLAQHVKAGTFREDLYVQLTATRIDLPPLRTRKEDIPLLVDSFVEKYAGSESTVQFSRRAIDYLLAYDWPGNVRELEDTVRRMLAFDYDPVSEDLRNLIAVNSTRNDFESPEFGAERDAIECALRETHGDKSSAAHSLGIAESTLDRRLKFFRL